MASATSSPVVVGAVLYDPKVSVIWDIIRDFFEARGCPMDVVLYTNYELQVDALLAKHIDVAWNSPLAWVDAQRRSSGRCRAIAMRDTDRDRQSLRRGAGGEPDDERRRPARAHHRGGRARLAAGDADPARAAPARRARAGARLHRAAVRRAGRQARRSRRRRARRLPLPRARRGRRLDRARPDVEGLDQGRHRRSRRAGGSSPPPTASTTASSPCASDFEPERESALARRPVLDELRQSGPPRDDGHGGPAAWLPGRTTGFGPLPEAVERQSFFEAGEGTSA